MNIDWESEEIQNLFKIKNDGELSRHLGVSRQRVHQVRKKLGIESYTASRRRKIVESGLLGVIPDAEVENNVCEDRKYVASVRQKLGIKAIRKSKLDEHLHLIGKMPDTQVAKLTGVSQSAISAYRKRRNISPYRPRTVRNDS